MEICLEVRAVPGNQSLSDFPVIQGIYREIGVFLAAQGAGDALNPAIFLRFREKFPAKIRGNSRRDNRESIFP
jgi:hypothetical protein